MIHCNFKVHCPKENTLLITSEPSSIKVYESAYLKQFAYVLSGQEDWALKHKGKYTPNRLCFGITTNQLTTMQFTVIEKFNKTKSISTCLLIKTAKSHRTQKTTISPKQLKRLYPKWYGMAKGVHSIEASLKPSIITAIISQLKITPVNNWWTKNLPMPF